jgi:hypothetical protein
MLPMKTQCFFWFILRVNFGRITSEGATVVIREARNAIESLLRTRKQIN